jgi:hypothetical protein
MASPPRGHNVTYVLQSIYSDKEGATPFSFSKYGCHECRQVNVYVPSPVKAIWPRETSSALYEHHHDSKNYVGPMTTFFFIGVHKHEKPNTFWPPLGGLRTVRIHLTLAVTRFGIQECVSLLQPEILL